MSHCPDRAGTFSERFVSYDTGIIPGLRKKEKPGVLPFPPGLWYNEKEYNKRVYKHWEGDRTL